MERHARAIAPANIAFIKYWGKKDPILNLPFSHSFSMNLDNAKTTTEITFSPTLQADEGTINGKPLSGEELARTTQFLNSIRERAKVTDFAHIKSTNSFPTAAGIGSSASGFAALTLAGTAALQLKCTEKELSQYARLGSGSASRSIPDGFVEWIAGDSHETSYAVSIAEANHWDLVDLITVVEPDRKKVSTTEGHALAQTSPLFAKRIDELPKRVDAMRTALLEKDFATFGSILEIETWSMHLTTFTALPPMSYISPASLAVMRTLFELRAQDIPAFYTLDAGANVHVITREPYSIQVEKTLRELDGVVDVLPNRPTIGARLLDQEEK